MRTVLAGRGNLNQVWRRIPNVAEGARPMVHETRPAPTTMNAASQARLKKLHQIELKARLRPSSEKLRAQAWFNYHTQRARNRQLNANPGLPEDLRGIPASQVQFMNRFGRAVAFALRRGSEEASSKAVLEIRAAIKYHTKKDKPSLTSFSSLSNRQPQHGWLPLSFHPEKLMSRDEQKQYTATALRLLFQALYRNHRFTHQEADYVYPLDRVPVKETTEAFAINRGAWQTRKVYPKSNQGINEEGKRILRSIMQVQRIARKKYARRATQSRREKKQQQETERLQRVREVEAAQTIQAAKRGLNARKNLQRKKTAVTRLQAGLKGMRNRKSTRQLRSIVARAVGKLQRTPPSTTPWLFVVAASLGLGAAVNRMVVSAGAKKEAKALVPQVLGETDLQLELANALQKVSTLRNKVNNQSARAKKKQAFVKQQLKSASVKVSSLQQELQEVLTRAPEKEISTLRNKISNQSARAQTKQAFFKQQLTSARANVSSLQQQLQEVLARVPENEIIKAIEHVDVHAAKPFSQPISLSAVVALVLVVLAMVGFLKKSSRITRYTRYFTGIQLMQMGHGVGDRVIMPRRTGSGTSSYSLESRGSTFIALMQG